MSRRRNRFTPTEITRYLSLVLYIWSFNSSLLLSCTCNLVFDRYKVNYWDVRWDALSYMILVIILLIFYFLAFPTNTHMINLG